MKKPKTSSNLHIALVIIILVALACLVAALCLFDYNFDVSFVEMWQANIPSLILAGAFVALNLVLIISAIKLRVKNDELTRSEVGLSFMIAAVLLLELILCVPIFIMWIVERLHDAVSTHKNKKLDF